MARASAISRIGLSVCMMAGSGRRRGRWRPEEGPNTKRKARAPRQYRGSRPVSARSRRSAGRNPTPGAEEPAGPCAIVSRLPAAGPARPRAGDRATDGEPAPHPVHRGRNGAVRQDRRPRRRGRLAAEGARRARPRRPRRHPRVLVHRAGGARAARRDPAGPGEPSRAHRRRVAAGRDVRGEAPRQRRARLLHRGAQPVRSARRLRLLGRPVPVRVLQPCRARSARGRARLAPRRRPRPRLARGVVDPVARDRRAARRPLPRHPVGLHDPQPAAPGARAARHPPLPRDRGRLAAGGGVRRGQPARAGGVPRDDGEHGEPDVRARDPDAARAAPASTGCSGTATSTCTGS